MGSYIIIFKESATKEQIDAYINRINECGGSIKYRYDSLMNGVAAILSDSFVDSFSKDEIVDIFEPDGVATTQGVGI